MTEEETARIVKEILEESVDSRSLARDGLSTVREVSDTQEGSTATEKLHPRFTGNFKYTGK